MITKTTHSLQPSTRIPRERGKGYPTLGHRNLQKWDIESGVSMKISRQLASAVSNGRKFLGCCGFGHNRVQGRCLSDGTHNLGAEAFLSRKMS
jgi:hypothetical protein